MQPDLGSPQQDDKQPEPPPMHEAPPSIPAPAQVKKQPKRNIAAIILGLFAFILLLAVAGLGFWAFSLNTKLTAAQQELTALQGEHSTLQADYAALTSEKKKLDADLTQSKSNLDKTNTHLATAQTDLAKSQEEIKALDAKISKAKKLSDILYTFTTAKSASDIFKVDTLVKDANNASLKAKWDKFTASPSPEGSSDFIFYLITSIRDTLK